MRARVDWSVGGAAAWCLAAAVGLMAPAETGAEMNWRTTHGTAEGGTVKLVYSQIKVKVTPAYLDVEEEAEVLAVGGPIAGGDARSLEIFGQFNMVPGATVVSFLLWNGDILLKARLKGTVMAREDYEKVVDRNTTPPPRPRDPALIEALGDGNYNLFIYPVNAGKSRRMRIRYHIPAQMAEGGVMLRLRSIFPPQIADNPGRIQVKWERGGGEEEWVLYTDNRAQALSLPSTSLIQSAADVYLTQKVPARALAATTSFGEGSFLGKYIAMHFQVPEKITNYPALSSTPNYSVVAILRNGADQYALDVSCEAQNGLRCDPVVFHGKSSQAWSPDVEWKLYNGAGRELASVTTSPQVYRVQDDTTQVVLWAGSSLPFAETRERWLGFKYGFVDPTASLLALEQDLLPAALVPLYTASGVPRLTRGDIFAPDTNDVFVPVPIGGPNNPIPGDRPVTTVRKLGLAGGQVLARVLPGGAGRGHAVLSLNLARLGKPVTGKVRVSILGLDGREVYAADLAVSSDGGPALVSLPALKDGFYFVKVEGVNFRWSGRILLRR